MKISFSPQYINAALSLEKSQGDRLRINGELFNFNPIPDGATIAEGQIPCEWIIGPVHRLDGQIHITFRLPIPMGCNEPWMCFPEPLDVTDDGSIDLPFATYSEVSEAAVDGGRNVTTTTYRWQQEPMVKTIFVADPSEPEEEPANVEP